MFSFNRVHIIGYQTQPITVRQTPSGSSVTDLNLAVPYTFQSEKGETLTGKGFHTVTLWGPMAEVAGKFAKAGSQMFISGRLQTDTWEDEKTSEKRSKTKIVGLDMILLDPKEGQRPFPEGSKFVGRCLNRVDVIGNVTRDPEMRTTTGGQQVLTIGVATNERWKDRVKNEDRERTEFHNVVIWGDLAQEVSKFARKGTKVFVSGRVQTRSWESKEGQKRYTTEIVADSVSLLGVSNPALKDVISMDGSSQSRSAAPSYETQHTGSVASESFNQDIPAVESPAMAYASEVKAEDLPF